MAWIRMIFFSWLESTPCNEELIVLVKKGVSLQDRFELVSVVLRRKFKHFPLYAVKVLDIVISNYKWEGPNRQLWPSSSLPILPPVLLCCARSIPTGLCLQKKMIFGGMLYTLNWTHYINKNKPARPFFVVVAVIVLLQQPLFIQWI